jgi:hypothetical protein
MPVDMKSFEFYEMQKFRQWWIWLLLILIGSLFILAFFIQVINGQDFGNNPMSDWGIITGCILYSFFIWFFVILKLETTIHPAGIGYRFFPFHRKVRSICWEEIQNIYVRQYSPLGEFGGWGLRGGAYNVSGNMGIQIEFKNGKTLLLGTRKPEQARNAIHELTAHLLKNESDS